MRRIGLLVLLVLGCGGPEHDTSLELGSAGPLGESASSVVEPGAPLPSATFGLPRVHPLTLYELPPEGPNGPVPFTFEDSGCRFVRPPLEPAPVPVPAPRLCSASTPQSGSTTKFDALGRPVEGVSAGASMMAGFVVRLDAKGRVSYRRRSARGDDLVWYRYDNADVERVAVRVVDGRINYGVAAIAPDCRSIRWQWRSANYFAGHRAVEWARDHWRLEEFDASGVLVAVTRTTYPTDAPERTTYRYHSNGVVAREEVTVADRSTVREFDPAGRRVFERRTLRGVEAYRYTATYDDAHLLASDERTPAGDPRQRAYEATYDGRGHLLHTREYLDWVRDETVTDTALQWSGDLLAREDRRFHWVMFHAADGGAGDLSGEWSRAEVHTYDARGLRIRTSVDTDGDGSFEEISRFTYDSAGLLRLEDHRAPYAFERFRRWVEHDAAGRTTRELKTYEDGRVEESSWTWCE